VSLRLVALALLVVACAPGQPGARAGETPAAASGIRGTVILGPTCPTGSEPGAHDPVPCLTPYAAQLVVLDAQDQVVARLSSGDDGHFQVDLPPGEYVIAPQSGDPFPIAQPVTVLVNPGSYAEVQVNYDTGIR
jgi:hypothetical protein